MMRGCWLLSLMLAACVPYVARPIEPSAHARAYRARRLDDPRLVEWVARWAGRPDGGRWTDRQLAVAALGLRADLTRARADWRAARAGEPAAGARPAPGAEAAVERAVAGSEDQSPWVVSLAGLLAVELGGKRGARLQRARARTAVAEGELRLAAWRVIHQVRSGAAGLGAAEAGLAQVRGELAALGEVQALERARFEEGSLTSAELERTAAELQDVRGRATAAEGAVLDARAALAGALALPPLALDSLVVAREGGPGCASLATRGPDSIAAAALTRRPEMGRALAEYAVAEAELRLQVARQYPDLELGPGFIWDQGVHRWTLALALPNLLAFRNRAAIGEADALRAASAARVAEVQDDLLGGVAAAIARCQGALLERAAADSQVAAARRARERADAAYARGETSRLDPALAALTAVRADRARTDAEIRLVSASLALEGAAADWGNGEHEDWPDPRTDELTQGAP